MATAAYLSFYLLVVYFCFDYVLSGQPPLVQFGPIGGNVFFEETTAIGTKLFSITATDQDSTSLTFVATNEATKDLVSVGTPMNTGTNSWSVDVFLNGQLDRDRSPKTQVLLFMVSDEDNQMEGQVKLVITDSNDNPPAFVNLPYRITLEEGTGKINTTVFVVKAEDPDDGPGGSVVYSMASFAQGADELYNKTFVLLDETSGNVTLAQPLDYEQRNYYQYQIFGKDRGNPPCPGPLCPCSNVTEPSVVCAGEPATFIITVYRGNPSCPGPDCPCSNVTEPSVVCAGEPATFIITVRDVQDSPPYFERLPYIAHVMENATVGTSVFQVSALDGDRGVPNGVTYSIVDESKYPFAIDNSTGVLSVGSSGLDADQPDGRSYVVTVMATEVVTAGQVQTGLTSATTQVSVTVYDINDNGPQFKETVYRARVQENTPRGVPLTIEGNAVEVSDKDQSEGSAVGSKEGENSQFVLTVEQSGSAYSVFQTLPGSNTVVQASTTVMISVYNSTVLDYETTQNITFQLRATENSTTEKNSNITTIILEIEDMNDNSPVFTPEQTTQVNVTEHEATGTPLATFTATDADSGQFGNVSYSLEDDLGGTFAIDPQHGNLSVEADLDREAAGGAASSLVVVATDNMAGEEVLRRSSRLTIRVSVLDINDQSPVFQPHPESVTVQENASPNTTMMTITATDKDEEENGRVRYSVLSVASQYSAASQHLFGVHDSSGVIFVNSSLIGHPGAFNVTFLASDSGSDPRNSTTMVIVNVRDVNIKAPKFITPDGDVLNTTLQIIPNITVDEEQDVGSPLLTLHATDEDTGDNGLVFYFVEPDLAGHFSYFHVDYQTGKLTNKLKLDRETFRMLQITLEAKDQGEPTQLATLLPFQVILRDIDDNPPIFPVRTLSLAVGEELSNVAVGLVNVSTDADSDPLNKVTCYYIYGGASSFSLAKETGALRLESKLDRDITPTVTLVVKATANCSLPFDQFIANGTNDYNSSDNSLLQVMVTVEDINDNPPTFDEQALTVGLVYDEDIGFEVIDLASYTRDGDTPIHSRNMFSLLSTRVGGGMPEQSVAPFSVTGNGSVVTRRLFSSSESGFFVLGVMAYDDDRQNDTADVTIYLVSDVQRVKLVFNKQPNDVELIKGDLVTKLSAALDMNVIADKIATHTTTSGTADPLRTDVFIHARRRPSGEIVPTSELLNAFDYNAEVRAIFQDLGATETLPVQQDEDTGEDEGLTKAFIIVTLVLAIVCLVLVVVLINTYRRYRRRLRAATTSAFVSGKQEPNSYIPPGTNRYYAAENPLFGKDMKPVNVDKLGDNDSLDDNEVDGIKVPPGGEGPGGEPSREEEQEMYLELFDEGSHPGVHLNHLAMVLHEYEKEGGRGGDEGSDADLSPPPYLTAGADGDKWRSALNGHVKSDSGFNEHPNDDHLPCTDI